MKAMCTDSNAYKIHRYIGYEILCVFVSKFRLGMELCDLSKLGT